jgi:competence protein ComEA
MTIRALVAALLLSCNVAAHAVDANTANRAQLEQVRHIGPPLAEAMLVARDKDGPFKDWADLMKRVRGIRAAKAAKLSEAGLSVGGVPYSATARP